MAYSLPIGTPSLLLRSRPCHCAVFRTSRFIRLDDPWRFAVPRLIGSQMTKRLRPQKGSLALPLRWVGMLIRALVGTPARAVRGTARRVADPARQGRDYWRSERVTMRQSFVANLISAMTSLIAGLTLVGMDHRIEEVDGLFVLIPVSIGMRGNIFGALAARLGTSIHSGLFEVSRRREGILWQNISAAVLLTIATSVTMGLMGRAVASLLGIETVSLWDLIVVALLGGLISSVV